MMTIIQAKYQYLNQIYSIILELAKYEGILDKVKITEKKLGELLFCHQPNHFVGVSLINEQICGFVMFNYTHNNVCFNVEKGIYIENMYVSPEYRRQGIGKALFAYVARKAAASKCSRIEWWVNSENNKAKMFYKKLGAIPLPKWIIFKCEQPKINNLIGIGSDN